MKISLPTLSNEKKFADQADTKRGTSWCEPVLMSQPSVGAFSVNVFTICRSSMRAFTPASISFLSWGVSGHGYNVALNLRTDEETQISICWPKTHQKSYKYCPVTYPSQIFLTLFLSWSPWKKMMKTDLWTWSPCGNIIQSRLWSV